jgi:dTDP-glucose 4,6-dehydratase
MANIIVAGGSGFIGSHLCKRLIDEGNEVYCIDNLISGARENIAKLEGNPKFHFFEEDISKPLSFADKLHDIDAIFHLASPASPNKKSKRSYMSFPIETMLANSVGTYNLLILARDKNAKFLFTSTSEVYGNPNISPQPETYNGNVNPNGVRSVYDEAKRFGEAMSFGFRRKYGMNIRIVRLFNTYGPFMQYDDGRVVTNFIDQALKSQPITIYGDGSQTRSFCYIDDLIEAMVRAMFYDHTDGEVINLGNPDERKIGDFAQIIEKLVETKSEISYEPLPEDDPLQRKPDITKANKLLQWEPKTSLEDGLKKTIEYFSTRMHTND